MCVLLGGRACNDNREGRSIGHKEQHLKQREEHGQNA